MLNVVWAQVLSHDPEVVEIVKNDKLLKPYASLQGIGDMLERVRCAHGLLLIEANVV